MVKMKAPPNPPLPPAAAGSKSRKNASLKKSFMEIFVGTRLVLFPHPQLPRRVQRHQTGQVFYLTGFENIAICLYSSSPPPPPSVTPVSFQVFLVGA